MKGRKSDNRGSSYLVRRTNGDSYKGKAQMRHLHRAAYDPDEDLKGYEKSKSKKQKYS